MAEHHGRTSAVVTYNNQNSILMAMYLRAAQVLCLLHNNRIFAFRKTDGDCSSADEQNLILALLTTAKFRLMGFLYSGYHLVDNTLFLLIIILSIMNNGFTLPEHHEIALFAAIGLEGFYDVMLYTHRYWILQRLSIYIGIVLYFLYFTIITVTAITSSGHADRPPHISINVVWAVLGTRFAAFILEELVDVAIDQQLHNDLVKLNQEKNERKRKATQDAPALAAAQNSNTAENREAHNSHTIGNSEGHNSHTTGNGVVNNSYTNENGEAHNLNTIENGEAHNSHTTRNGESQTLDPAGNGEAQESSGTSQSEQNVATKNTEEIATTKSDVAQGAAQTLKTMEAQNSQERVQTVMDLEAQHSQEAASKVRDAEAPQSQGPAQTVIDVEAQNSPRGSKTPRDVKAHTATTLASQDSRDGATAEDNIRLNSVTQESGGDSDTEDLVVRQKRVDRTLSFRIKKYLNVSRAVTMPDNVEYIGSMFAWSQKSVFDNNVWKMTKFPAFYSILLCLLPAIPAFLVLIPILALCLAGAFVIFIILLVVNICTCRCTDLCKGDYWIELRYV